MLKMGYISDESSIRLNRRQIHLEGARGIAALCVFVAHFAQVFLPQVFTPGAPSHGLGERNFATSIFNVLLNANFAVCFFFVLSAYVLSCRNYGQGSASSWAIAALKRYPRLAVPAIASVALAWLLASSPISLYTQVIFLSGSPLGDAYAATWSGLDVVYQGLWSAFLKGDSQINPVLWTMKVELWGSIFLFFFCWALSKIWRFRTIIYCLAILGIFFFGNLYYLAFVLGCLLNEGFLSIKKLPSRKRRFLVLLAFALATWLGSYPYYGGQGWPWAVLPAVKDPHALWHVLGAWLAVWILISTPAFARIMSGTLSRWLGRLSFPVYLVHWPVILVIGGNIVVKFAPHGYLAALVCGFFASCIATFLLALAFEKWVDRPAVAFANRLAYEVRMLIDGRTKSDASV